MTSPRYRSYAERLAQWRSDSHRLSDLLRQDAARLPTHGCMSVADLRANLLRIADLVDRTRQRLVLPLVLWGICSALFGWSLRGLIG